MERILIGHCTMCDAPLYMYIDRKKHKFSSTCSHKGVAKFIEDIESKDNDLLNGKAISLWKRRCGLVV